MNLIQMKIRDMLLVKTMIWTMKTADQMTMKTMETIDLDDDYIDYGTEAEDSERYSDYDEDDDWISHEIEESMETIRRKNR